MSLLDNTNNIIMSAVDLGNTFTAEMWFYVPNGPFPQYTLLEILSSVDNSLLASFKVSKPSGSFAQVTAAPFVGVTLYLFQNTWYHLAIIGGPDQNYEPSVMLFVNGIGYSVYSAPAITTVNLTCAPRLNIYNFKIIKDLPYGDTSLYEFMTTPPTTLPANPSTYQTSFAPSVILPLNFNDYLLVVYTLLQDVVIVGGVLASSSVAQAKGSVVTSVSNIKTSTLLPPGGLMPHATICFTAEAQVLTDNSGYVFIDKIIPGEHSIGGQTVLTVTRSITPDSNLVFIKANSLGENSPNVDTITSANHKILVNGEMTKAVNLVPSSASFVPYEQQTLYNVVLERRGTMIVNNMTVETLEKDNLLAKLYSDINQDMTKEQLDTRVILYNEYIKHLILGRTL